MPGSACFAGLNRVAVGQIEAGTRSVSSLELDRIAHAVGRDIKSFFAASFVERDALAALFRSDAELAEQADLLKALQDSLALGHEMTNLERLVEIDRVQLLTASYELPAPKSRWDAIQQEQGQKVAIEERQRLGLGVAPIGDLSELLEAQGVRTGVVALPENISGLTLVDSTIGVFVVINAKHAAVRQRFSLAHECGHVLLDRDRAGAISRAEKTEEDSGAGQTIANFLAAPEAPPDDSSRDDFRRRFLALALEAYRREEITRSKLAELAAMVHSGQNDLEAALASAKLD
ncbi:MAG: ImmA/IrrE family metallo-endopeptidase [Pseudomonadota bacterium]